MKSLSMSLAIAVSLGLCSAALADHGCGVKPASCCSHGLLSKLKLHGGCCAAKPVCKPKCAPKPACKPKSRTWVWRSMK